MVWKSKRQKEMEKVVGEPKVLSLEAAIELLKKCPKVKFDVSLEISIKLGVDIKKSDQQVRGTVSLPHGSGKKSIVLVFAKGDKVKEALDAGADYAGHDELIEKVKGGWTEFTTVVSTPDMMREVGKLGKVLGPRGLMPTPKAGTVTMEIGKAVKDIKQGKVEFKADKSGIVNLSVGKLSFSNEQLLENIRALYASVEKAKPPTSKGVFIQSVVISSTMGPGLKVNVD